MPLLLLPLPPIGNGVVTGRGRRSDRERVTSAPRRWTISPAVRHITREVDHPNAQSPLPRCGVCYRRDMGHIGLNIFR